MPDDTMTNIQRLIDGFVKKNLPVAADRLYLPAELGGLGMFEIKKISSGTALLMDSACG